MNGADSRLGPVADQLLQWMVGIELGNAPCEEGARLTPLPRDEAAERRKPAARIQVPQRTPKRRRRYRELQRGDAPARPDDACELAQRRRRIVYVAQQVCERQVVELPVREREALRFPLDERHSPSQCRVAREPGPRGLEHGGTLVEPDNGAPVAAHESPGDESC